MVGAGMGEPIRAIGMISWQGLIASSRLLITAPDANTPPLPDSIRRSVSTAYYAMFQAQAASNAECLSVRHKARSASMPGYEPTAVWTTVRPGAT